MVNINNNLIAGIVITSAIVGLLVMNGLSNTYKYKNDTTNTRPNNSLDDVSDNDSEYNNDRDEYYKNNYD
jgi:hypothetical protein